MKTAIVIALLMALVGFGLLVCGVYVLAGLGWSLVAGACSAFTISGFIRQGIFQGVKS